MQICKILVLGINFVLPCNSEYYMHVCSLVSMYADLATLFYYLSQVSFSIHLELIIPVLGTEKSSFLKMGQGVWLFQCEMTILRKVQSNFL